MRFPQVKLFKVWVEHIIYIRIRRIMLRNTRLEFTMNLIFIPMFLLYLVAKN